MGVSRLQLVVEMCIIAHVSLASVMDMTRICCSQYIARLIMRKSSAYAPEVGKSYSVPCEVSFKRIVQYVSSDEDVSCVADVPQ